MKLLETTQIGTTTLRNRMVMAPMTRSRASATGVISDLTVQYYRQRASAGLIVTEGINISEQGQGSPFTPGIYTAPQVEVWKKVTAAVHEAGGVIFAQLWHTGRVGHSIDKNGKLPVSASAIAIQGQQHFTSQGMQDYETPIALDPAGVKQVVQDYRQAAIHAKEAGFDGIELHGANGYLPNQFLAESSNQRTDEYGGSIENRSRFVLEIMRELVDVWGPSKAGIKLSPSSVYNNVVDSNPVALYSHLIAELDKLPLAYLHLMQPLGPMDSYPQYPSDVLKTFAGLIHLPVIMNGGYKRDTAESAVSDNGATMVSFGVQFLSNPDLPRRFELNAELNAPDFSTLYSGGEKGYIDYPVLPS